MTREDGMPLVEHTRSGQGWVAQASDWIALMPGDFDFGRAAHVAHLQLDVTF